MNISKSQSVQASFLSSVQSATNDKRQILLANMMDKCAHRNHILMSWMDFVHFDLILSDCVLELRDKFGWSDLEYALDDFKTSYTFASSHRCENVVLSSAKFILILGYMCGIYGVYA